MAGIPRTQTFGALGWWLEQTKDHLALRWKDHVTPTLALMGLNMIVAMVAVVGATALIFAAIVVVEIVDQEWPVIVVTLLVLPLTLGLGVVNSVLHGVYVGAVVELSDDEALSLESLKGPARRVGALAVVQCLNLVLVLGGVMACYIPGILISAVLAMAPALLFIEGLGPLAAMRRSLQLSLLRPVDVCCAGFLKVVVAMMAGSVPGVGLLLAVAMVPAIVVFDITMARSLIGLEAHLRAHPEHAG